MKDRFMTSDAVDFLMGQKDGANYVVLYQMLCLKTINTDGRLERQIGEIIIPYDIEKIQRDCKWFSVDTIRIALNLYKALGLVYSDENGVLVIANHNEMVGYTTDWAIQKKNQRTLNDSKKASNIPVLPDSSDEEKGVELVHTNVHTENRDKEIKSTEIKILDNRDKDIESVKSISDEIDCRSCARRIAQKWNEIGVSKIKNFDIHKSTRGKMLKARLSQHGEQAIMEAIENVKRSRFLQGDNDRGWIITFDWFLKPSNFQKVLEGTYDDRNAPEAKTQQKPTSTADRILNMIKNGELKG